MTAAVTTVAVPSGAPDADRCESRDAADQTRRHVEFARPQQRRHLAAQDVADDAAARAGDRAEHHREHGIDGARLERLHHARGVEEAEAERVGHAQRRAEALDHAGQAHRDERAEHDREEIMRIAKTLRRNAEDRVADHAAAERRRERQDEGADHVGPLGATRDDAAHREARDAEQFESVDHAPTLASA